MAVERSDLRGAPNRRSRDCERSRRHPRCSAIAAPDGADLTAALTLRIPDDKHQRLRDLAQIRGTTINRLLDEMTTRMLAEFDADTRFQLRAARGAGKVSRGLELVDKAAAAGSAEQ